MEISLLKLMITAVIVIDLVLSKFPYCPLLVQNECSKVLVCNASHFLSFLILGPPRVLGYCFCFFLLPYLHFEKTDVEITQLCLL